MEDSQILDWLEANPDKDITFRNIKGKPLWRVYDGKMSDYRTQTLAKGLTLREAITKAIEFPYA